MVRLDSGFEDLQLALLDWFANNVRNFPWRNTKNPYHIIIAEKLLQQTRVNESLVSTYNKLLNKYPTPLDLARADVAELEVLIKPHGLSFRAHHIQQMAQEIVEYHGGQVPSNLVDLQNLTGIGEYAARAVLCFAFNCDVPIIDTNVSRFIHRIFGIDGNLPVNPSRKKYLTEIATNLLPRGRVRDFNLAVLDLCAEICTAKNPKCQICPISIYCEYGKDRTTKGE